MAFVNTVIDSVADAFVAEIEEFFTGTRSAPLDTDRVLATVLFTDIVDSTRAAERLERWRDAGPGSGALDEVRAALDDDLDTPAAVRALDAAALAGQGVSAGAGLLGVRFDN